MLPLSIFVSSPGDVAEERATVRRVASELEDSHLLRGKVHFQVIAWDDPNAAVPMEAGVTPQGSVNRYAGRPSDCDLTLVILWGRLGTPLPPDILRADGSRYASGTVWELEDAQGANRPVWIYRRSGKPMLDEKAPDYAARSSQYNEVENFFAGFKSPDGSLRSGFNSYSDPADFAKQLRQHLEAYVSERLAREPARPALKPNLSIPPYGVVGRSELIKKVQAGLQAGQRDFAFVFLPGVGKTAIAAKLVNDQEVMQHFPEGALWVHLGQNPDICQQLSRWASALGVQKNATEGKDAAELGEVVAQAIGESRMLLVIDDAWTTEACEHFMLGGLNCARIITTRITDVANELMPNRAIKVNELSEEDGFLLLASIAPLAAGIAPEALRQLVVHVDGLPIALVLIGRMLQRCEDDRAAIEDTLKELDDIRQIFREKRPKEFTEDSHYTWEEVVEASYRALGTAGALNRDEKSGDQLRSALEALSALRPDPAWFPLSLARLVTGAPDKTIRALAGSGLIERVRFEGDNSQKNEETRYCMHCMIAEYIRAKLPPERLLAINQTAANFYLDQLEKLEERYQSGKATTYSVMYRYEDEEWQDCQDNWLYYCAQTGYGAEATLSFLRAWLDGFWWWCCFTAEGFDFCDQLLVEWDHKLALASVGAGQGGHVERLKQGIVLLRRFKDAYPKETEDRGGGSWPEVKKALHELLGMARLDGDIAGLANPDARHVRALTDIFLAEAERFGEGDFAVAEACYREAVALFREAEDEEKWNIAWSLYHLADMLGTLGRHDEASVLCAEAMTFGQAENDFEVIANIYRLLGDCAMAGRRIEEALQNFRLAVEYAYRFQVEPEDPDSYTIRFYADMAQRVAGRLLDARAVLPDAAQHIARALRQGWAFCGIALATVADEGALLDGATAGSLAKSLFPPALPMEKLKSDGASYARAVRGNIAAVERQVAQAAGAGALAKELDPMTR